MVANDDVTFSVGKGEIHALLGENGAGKSTLVKLIYGVMQPDEGAMRLNGTSYSPTKPADAREKGVGLVFQHFSLFEGLTVAENIALGIPSRFANKNLRESIVALSAAYGLQLDPDRRVGNLSVGERQRVEIVRCLIQQPKLLIMDEPTSVLTPQEADALFVTLRRLASEGCSVLYISHKLEEIRTLCSHATILRDGRVVASCDPSQQTARGLAEMMIGATLVPPQRDAVAIGPARLMIDGLTLARAERFGVDLENIHLDVKGGEIVGIAGVAGNGQSELMEALIGERLAPAPGDIVLDGVPVGRSGPAGRRGLGMCFVPEERLGHGAVPDMTLWENAVLTASTRMNLSTFGCIDASRARTFADKVVSEFGVRTRGVDSTARSLSGGNLQKFMVGREVLQAPGVLIAAQPTWGVDAGAAGEIHKFLLSLARRGAAILIVSQDLDELLAISTRIAVMAGGCLTAARPVEQLTTEQIGRDMGARAPASEHRESGHA